jgi:hypothetical protein
VGSSWLDLLRNAFFIGGIVAFTWIGIQRGQIRGLKDSVDGLRGDRDDRDKRLADRDAAMLVERNQRALAAHHADAMSGIDKIEAALVRVEKALGPRGLS